MLADVCCEAAAFRHGELKMQVCEIRREDFFLVCRCSHAVRFGEEYDFRSGMRSCQDSKAELPAESPQEHSRVATLVT